MPSPIGPVTFVVPGDLHLEEPDRDNHIAALEMVHQVNTLIRPDFVQFIGDNVQHTTAAQFEMFDDLRNRLEVPHYALVGDHDVHGDPDATGFRRHVGPTFGSTSLRGVRFIRLDTQQAKPVGMSSQQIDWFQAEIDAAAEAGERVVLFQHNYPYQIWETFDGPGLDDWRSIVQSRRIEAIVCGHTHYLQYANDGRNALVATRSIGDPEGGEAGYLVGFIEEEDLALAFNPVSRGGAMAMVTRPRNLILATRPGHVVTGPDRFRVRTWPATGFSRGTGRIDDGPPFPLGQDVPGLWSAELPGHMLPKGVHSFEAMLEHPLHGLRGDRVEFMVDPTGRFTAVPEVWPRVTSTRFC